MSIYKEATWAYTSRAKTVLELIQDLQRAIIVGELNEDSEILNEALETARITINPMHKHIVVD